MSEVKQVTAIVSNPSGPDDCGRVTIGYYTLEGNLLTMTDGKGEAVRTLMGEKMTHKLQAGENPALIAKRLTLRIFERNGGGNGAGFGRRLVYPGVGVA